MRLRMFASLILLTSVGCQSGAPRAVETPTPDASPASSAATVTPAIAAAEATVTVEATVEALPTTIAVVRATPAPLPTPVPVSQALMPTATNLQTKLAALRSAQRTQDVGSALRAQRELLSAADQADAALKNDKSRQAQNVRAATADIRSGISNGDNNGFEHADATLRQVLGGDATAGLTVTSQAPAPVTADPKVLQQQVRQLQQAVQNRNSGDALRLQGQLLVQLSAAQKAAAADDSDSGRALQSALSDLQKGLDGDSARLLAAANALDKMGAPSDQTTISTDVPRVAESLVTKIDAFRAAASTGSRVDLLRLQQEILTEADQASNALTADQTPPAAAVRGSLNDVRAGVSGDLSKLDGARSELARVAGVPEEAPASDHDAASSPAAITDLKRFAGDLDGTVTSFQAALQKNDTASMLRLQRRLSDLASQADSNLKEAQNKPADEVRTAVAAIRTAFAGDFAKLDEAHIHLRAVSGGTAAQSVASTAATSTAPTSDLQGVVGGVRGRVADLASAVRDHQTGDEIDKRRAALRAEIDKAEAALKGATDPKADRARAALTAAREAAGGDDAKAASAQAALDGSLNGQ